MLVSPKERIRSLPSLSQLPCLGLRCGFVEGVLIGSPRGLGLAITAVIILYGASAGVGLYRLAIKRTREAMFTKAERWPLPDRAFAWGLVFFVPTIAFAAVTTQLVQYDALTVEGAASRDPDLTSQAFAAYLWSLADAVPLLKIPETLNWEPPLRFPTWEGGSLALAYKLVLLVPAAQLLTFALTRLWGADTLQADRQTAQRARTVRATLQSSGQCRHR